MKKARARRRTVGIHANLRLSLASMQAVILRIQISPRLVYCGNYVFSLKSPYIELLLYAEARQGARLAAQQPKRDKQGSSKRTSLPSLPPGVNKKQSHIAVKAYVALFEGPIYDTH